MPSPGGDAITPAVVALSADLAELDRAHVTARVAWEAARTYEEAAFQTFAAASTAYILAIAAQERGGA